MVTPARLEHEHHESGIMNFSSLYDQGFARVAAATSNTAIADPATNATRVIEHARRIADTVTLTASSIAFTQTTHAAHACRQAYEPEPSAGEAIQEQRAACIRR